MTKRMTEEEQKIISLSLHKISNPCKFIIPFLSLTYKFYIDKFSIEPTVTQKFSKTYGLKKKRNYNFVNSQHMKLLKNNIRLYNIIYKCYIGKLLIGSSIIAIRKTKIECVGWGD